jgi:hypothetical protein
MTENNFKKKLIPCSLYDARHIDSRKWRYYKVLHIDVRRSNWTKLWNLNAIPKSSWDICIHLWNLKGCCIAIAKPTVPSMTFLGSSLKQDVFCRISFFGVPFLFATKMQRWIFWGRRLDNNSVQKTPSHFSYR